MSVFLDTSFLYALISGRDQLWRVARTTPFPVTGMITSSLVVNETVTLLQSRTRFSDALAFLNRIRGDQEIEIVYPDAHIQQSGWDLLTRYGSIGANAVDCTSFAVMHARHIKLAYTFDEHFRAAGFRTLVPK